MFVSETYSIEDCHAYVTSLSNWTSHTNKSTVYVFSPFTCPSDVKIEFKLKTSMRIQIAMGDMTHTNSGGWLEWIYAWYQNYRLYYRTSSNGESYVSCSDTINTSTIYKVEYSKSNNNVKTYVDGTQIKSQTTYDTLNLDKYIRIPVGSSAHQGSDNIDWIKVKPL